MGVMTAKSSVHQSVMHFLLCDFVMSDAS